MRLSIAAAVVCLSIVGMAAADPAAASIKKFTDIPAQELGSALQTLAREHDFQVVYLSDSVDRLKTSGAVGEFTAEEALKRLLKGTGLSYRYLDEKTVTILPASSTSAGSSADEKVPRTTSNDSGSQAGGKEAGDKSLWQRFRVAQVDQAAAGPQVASSNDQNAEKGKKEKDEGLSEIVVTGTLIHGADPLSPLITITRDDILNQGYSRLDQVIEQLPQNFKAGASPQSNPSNVLGEGASANYSRGSSVNLRGLGANATLTLLDGQRLSMSNFGQSVDISTIPVSIIDRVEILTDGASAVYGADAVGGVVNIITRSDYSGLEVGTRETNWSSGKAPNPGGNILSGTRWSSGNFVINYDFEKDHALYTRDRSYTSLNGDPTTILPDQTISSIFSALHQDLGAGFTLSANVLFNRKDLSYVDTNSPTIPTSYGGQYSSPTSNDSNQFTGVVQLGYQFDDWRASLGGHYSKETGNLWYTAVFPTQAGQTILRNRNPGVDLHLDGPLFELPGGAARLAVGVTAMSEKLEVDTGDLLTPATFLEGKSRNSKSVFSEVLLPLVGPQSGIPFVKSFAIDIAGRYDRYSDFGSTFNPKFALKWELPAGVSLHAVYGRSFRVPTLFEQIPAPLPAVIYDVPDPKSPTGTTRTLLYGNVDPNLKPERARSITAGLTFTPESVPDLKVDVSYFDILFTNKIEQLGALGFGVNVLTDEAELGSLVVRDPSLAAVNGVLNTPGQQVIDANGTGFTPDQIKALVNIGLVNAAVVHPRGLDLSSHYRFAIGNLGHLAVDAAASYFTHFEDQLAEGATSFSPVNLPYVPTKFRGKLNLGWTRAGWAVYSRANFANAYQNPTTGDPRCPVSCPVSSYVTIDTGISFAFSNSRDVGLLRGTRMSLDISNAFNRAPPYVYDPHFTNYDATNADALQRAVSISLRKKF